MPSGERNSDSHSPPSPNLNGQSCICEIVCLCVYQADKCAAIYVPDQRKVAFLSNKADK